VEHNLFGKPVFAFPGSALAGRILCVGRRLHVRSERRLLTQRVNGCVDLSCVHRTISLLQCGKEPIIGFQGYRNQGAK